MAIAKFAGKTFSVSKDKVYTFSEFTHGSTLETDKQESAGKKPSTLIKGPGLDAISFSINLKANFGVNPDKEWKSWKAIKDAAIPFPFLIGGVSVCANKWLLVDVQKSEPVIDNAGKFLSMKLALTFEEYVRKGTAEKAAAVAKNKTTPPGIEDVDYESDEADLFETDQESKVEFKRYNPNMS